ncbi:hypothetical protein BDP27DRAFT_1372252 [Rhodocollybia butyracea]|uniref:Uncharacterized protein n=1 Tax=Rhodocollybia butyracea TaxID=206335 RepID=A0A9P5TXY6_9AGAR|nr:hypothetical protein BDP27DRAFT_1372252 [Rhodocollybia butyracea]
MGETNPLNFAALNVKRCGTAQCPNNSSGNSILYAWTGCEPFNLLVQFTMWLYHSKEHKKFTLMVSKVVTLAKVHDKEGYVLKPALLAIFDRIHQSGVLKDNTNDKECAEDAGTEAVGTDDKEDNDKQTEQATVVPKYMTEHIERLAFQACILPTNKPELLLLPPGLICIHMPQSLQPYPVELLPQRLHPYDCPKLPTNTTPNPKKPPSSPA